MIKQYYDGDCATWSPQGKLFQVEYAMEAVKQGSVCLGLKSGTHAVLCSLKRQNQELASYQEKIFKIDDKIGMAIAGLTGDARIICKYMRNECLNYKSVFNSNHPLQRLVEKVASKSQKKTQSAGKRPYGVGLLIAGYDEQGPHIFETCPSANFYEYHCYSIGARSQGARTYFETHFARFGNSTRDQLILHGLKALKKASTEDDELKPQSVEISFVGKDEPFRALTEAEIEDYLKRAEAFNPND